MIDALTDPQRLYVFGVIAARTSNGTRTTSSVTPFGLMRETSLSREAAVACLKRAGLVEVLVNDEHGEEHGYESWRISEAALAAASRGSGVPAQSRGT
ncbi:MAG: hypothetical protein JO281_18140 [Pseudonocardiales bacterium]|nr:hypothetical protein [Pseudonocardiales bacterium]